MRKILVPVDGSENALRALRHVIALAKTNGPLTVHVVSAHEEPIVYGEVASHISKEMIEGLQRKLCEVPLAAATRELTAAGLTFTQEILSGPIAQTIAKRADELGCDGIVMGTRGMSAMGGLLLGSVAMKVVHAAKVPVTLVK